jgi:alkylated DNA repair protein alkB family protein 1
MQSPSGPRQLVSNTAANATNVHSLTLSASAQPAPAPSTTVPPSSPSDLTRKLRWANIGWFYHWGTKQYDFTKGKIDVDPQIRELCQGVVQAINWDHVFYDDDESQWEGNGEDWRAWDETYGM